MPIARNADPLKLYAELMGEVKVRLRAIEGALEGRTELIGPLVREFCFLQLRMICELIALGCLTAHGDTAGVLTKKMGKEWHAGNIMRHLSDLHPLFYPRLMVKLATAYHKHYTLHEITSGILHKNDLIKLYESAGVVLHKGSIKKLLSPRRQYTHHFRDIAEWTKKTRALLWYHVIALEGQPTTRLLICDLGERETDPVSAGFADASHIDHAPDA